MNPEENNAIATINPGNVNEPMKKAAPAAATKTVPIIKCRASSLLKRIGLLVRGARMTLAP